MVSINTFLIVFIWCYKFLNTEYETKNKTRQTLSVFILPL